MAVSKAQPRRPCPNDDLASVSPDRDRPLTDPPSLPRPSAPPTATENVPPRARFQLPFPTLLERVFAPLDDALIAVGQRRTVGLVHKFSMGLTFFTSIEISLVAPPTLYALGYDAAAGLAASVLLVLGVISQVPKKFIFRPRPWMVGRALPIRRDKTSSFPSRAVVCAVVFSWLVGQCLVEEHLLPSLSPPVLWVGIILMACLAAFARVNVGAHYPSDTLLGFVLGCLVIWIGMQLEFMWRAAGCSLSAVSLNATEAAVGSTTVLFGLGRSQLRNLSVATLVAYIVTLISLQGFWVKCSYVYGLLMSASAFRATFLCSGHRDAEKSLVLAEQLIHHGFTTDHITAAATFTLLLLFGMATRGRKGIFRIAAFTIIYFGTFVGMTFWRFYRRPFLQLAGG